MKIKIDFDKFNLRILLIAAMFMTCAAIFQSQTYAEETFPDLQSLGISEYTTTIIGKPESRISSSEDETSKEMLSEEKAKKVSLQIIQVDGKFYWASRDNQELVHRVNGTFDYFYPFDGSGYIKAYRIDGKAKYMEHVHIWLSTITY